MTTILEDFIGKIVVVLVIYETPLESSPAFRSLCIALRPFDSASSIFIYDNSAKSQLFREKNWGSITYYHDPENAGVSKAYNKAFEYANTVGKKWLLFADQDTVFPENFFTELSESHARNPSRQVFVPVMRDETGIVSPFQFTFGRGFRVKDIQPGTLDLSKWNFINSGLLISTKLFQKSGGYDERFLLDFSDLSFQRRIMKYTNEAQLVDVACLHSLSANQLQDRDDVLERFYVYSHASRMFSIAYRNHFILIVMLLRSVKLSYKYSTTSFIVAAGKYLFSKAPHSLRSV